MRALILFLLLIAAAFPRAATAQEAPTPLAARAAELPALLRGETAPEAFFAPAFLDQVPPERFGAISAQLRASYGRAEGISRIEAKSAIQGTVFVDFERATVEMRLSAAPAPPHLVQGLLITGAEVKGDDLATVFRELTGLGEVSLAVARLEEAGPAPFLVHEPERAQAVGSAFKLFILAELVRAVEAGEKRWDEVVPLGRRSLPSGILQEWPEGSPLTLHSLATLMIARSDNSAADTLLHHLGREKVEAMLAMLGVEAAARNRPFLSTREAFALKLADPALLAAWKAGDEGARRALLPRLAEVKDAALDPAPMAAAPVAIAEVEWFASPMDLVRTLDWIRRSGDGHALAILAVNAGIGPGAADDFRYLGFKGGSETGVINMSFLLETRSGRWIALAATWNDAAKPLDEAGFIALMARLVAQLRDG